MQQANRHYSKPFRSLSQQERLFLYAARHWGRALTKAGSGSRHQQASVCDRAKLNGQMDLFMRSFAQALPEPLLLKPTQCRCEVVFHEATLLDLFCALRRRDRRSATNALQDMMPGDVCERLLSYLAPLISEIEFAVEALCQPSVPALPSSKV